MKLKQLAAVLGLGLLGATAQAGLHYQAWDFEDDSIEFILRADGEGFEIVTSGPAQIGDIFVGVFEMVSASRTPPGVSLIPPDKELTGVSVTQLVKITDSIWEFAPYKGGMNSILSLIGPDAPSVIGGDPGGGAVVAMWLNGTTKGPSPGTPPGSNTDRDLRLRAADPVWGDTTNCVSLEDCLREASLGTLFQVDGLWGVDQNDRKDPDNFWISQALFTPGVTFPPTYGDVKAGAKTTQFASFSAGLSTLFNVVEPVLFQKIGTGDLCPGATHASKDNCVQVRVSGLILGGAGLSNDAIGRNDVDASKLVAVPEPATLGLLGLGLLGLGLLRRRLG